MPAKRKPKTLWTAKIVDYGNDDTRVQIEAPKPLKSSEHLAFSIMVIDATLQKARET